MKALNKLLTISLLVTLFSLGFLYSYAQPGGLTITGNASVCAGTTGVVYSVNIPFTARSIAWYVPDGATIVSGWETKSITVNFSESAVSGDIRGFAVTLDNGKSVFKDFHVTVISRPSPVGIITGSNIVCLGANNVGYSVSAITGATGYTWTLPAGVSIASGANTNSISVNFSPAAVTGNISVYGTNSCPLQGSSSSITVNVGVPAAAGAIVGSNIVILGTVVPYSVPSVAGATSYNWELPSGATISSGANTNSIRVNFQPTAISGTIKVTPKNNCGNGLASSMTVSVKEIEPNGTISGSTSVCLGATGVVYSVNIPFTVRSIAWYVPDGATIVSGWETKSITVDFSESAVSGDIRGFAVTLDNAKLVFRDFHVTVISKPSAGIITGSNIVCPGTNNVGYSVSAITGAIGYTWTLPVGVSFVPGTSTNTNSISVNFSPAAVTGNISVYGTNSCPLSGHPTTKRINVGPPAAAAAIVGPNFITPGADVPYSVPSAEGADGYNWELPSGAAISSGANTSSIMVNFQPTVAFGTIKVTPTNSCGGGLTSSITVFVADITTSGPITINPLTASRSYLLLQTAGANLGTIGSDASLYSGGNSNSLGMYVYGNNKLEFSTNNEKRLVIGGDGNVGIGVTSPQYKLTVAGTIAAREVKITAELWADFVFHPTYKLRTLGEVEQFIKTNRHLPDVPTASEVKVNGVGIGEMNAKLLQKVEELTLYMIEQQKRIDEQQKKIDDQQKQIDELKKAK